MEVDNKCSKSEIISTTFLVIGGGIAGVSCTETLAYLCPNQPITLLTESNLIKAVKNLIPLAKHVYKFEIEERNVEEENKFGPHILTIVDQLKTINSKEKYIITATGRKILYTYLCLCTGARPKVIDSDNERIIGIRDTDSVLNFQKKLKESRRLVLVGNGGIASEISYEVKNVQIEWVIKDNHTTSTFVDPGAAHFFQQSRSKEVHDTKNVIKRMQYSETDINQASPSSLKHGAALGPDWHRKIDVHGNCENLKENLKIHYESEIKNVQCVTDNYPLLVTLTSGIEIACDFIVSATGVYPRKDFDCDQNFILGSDGGICVNELMETNISSIYAAGDVCFAAWGKSNNWFQMRLWTQARQMGCMAGRSMAAAMEKETIYQDFCFELFTHVTNLFGYQVVLLGLYNGQTLGTDYEILLRTTPGKEYIKFVLQNGKLRGAILIGDTGLEETCENLILNQIDLTPYGDDILNPDIDIEDYFD